ncbi:peptide/nickel transport system substrate-binding protein [Kribbella amoyensis]|uniref:Peptide/nickel transport system substrate-binding protein n=1 Tax=Kribbella amoyensis TaxID=996641 RepID=A0A561B384_9ACTN|nr:ABC transporter substrate-binding protein [Kribbella amoyensis]TWD73307.1 peptide/nickel transport system substrate-binding protein [Kribbella amoyensis]
MRHAKRVGSVVATGLALTLTLAACGGDNNNSSSGNTGGEEAAKGGTVTVYHASDFEHLDPARAFVTDVGMAGQLLYRTLTAFNWNAESKKVELVGDLADKWESSPDFKTWTFTLKDNLKYEDGSPITTKDIKYNVERSFSADLSEGAPYGKNFLDCKGYQGPYKPAGNNGGKGCTAITTADDKTIEFKLNQPVSEFPMTASMKIFAPTPQAKDTKTQYDNRVFSSGPYKVETYTRSKSLSLVRNTNWDQATDPIRTALPDKFEFKFGDDDAIVDQRLIQGTGADANSVSFSGVQPQNLAKLTQANVKDRVIEGPDVCKRYIGFNEQKPLLKNQKLREALTYAMDKQAYITARGGDRLNKPIDSIIPKEYEGYREQKTFEAPLTGDLDKAKAALAESGYKGEKLTLGASDATDIAVKAAEAAQAAWKRIGVNVDIKKIPGDNYYSTQQNDASATDLITAGWCADWASVSTIVAPVLGPDNTAPGKAAQNNYSRSNVGWDRMNEIPNIKDQKEAITAWADIHDEVMKTAPLVPISEDNNVYVLGSNITGATVNPDVGGLPDLTKIGLKKVG